MHENSMTLCRHFAEGLMVHGSGLLRIADVGSFDVNGTYRPLFARGHWKYVGFDIRGGPNVDVVLATPDSSSIEIQPEHLETFDVVISGQTMEHVRAPWRWFPGVVSLCKPGGLVWLCVPNDEKFHEYPIDCWRIWPDGMRALFAESGLTELVCRAQGPDTFGIGRKPG